MSLRDELTNDPLGRGYAGMTDEQAAASLNTANRDQKVVLDAADLNAWAAGGGRWRKLEAAKDGDAPVGISDAVRSVAIAAWRMLDRDNASLDLNDAEHEGLIDALVAGNVLTSDDKAALVARATKSISRAQELRDGGARMPVPVRVGDVITARAA